MSETLVEQLRERREGVKFCSFALYKILYGESCRCEHCEECNLLGEVADRIEAKYTPNSVVESDYDELPKDKNGKPIHVGNKVNISFRDKTHQEKVLFIGKVSGGDGICYFCEENGHLEWELAECCEVVEPPKPLTKEDIDAKATMDTYEYWKCNGLSCDNCPSKLDGKSPKEYYGVGSCISAKVLDLLRLERERVAVQAQRESDRELIEKLTAERDMLQESLDSILKLLR